MFKENKYYKIYYQLIDKRQRNLLSKSEVYCEKHHILPKSLGGLNDKGNLVNLLPREHFIAHLLLTKMVIEQDHVVKMNWALHKMCYSSVDYFNSKDYDWYRRRHVNFLRDHHPSKRIPGWNQKIRELITASWKNDEERRLNTAKTIKNWQISNREQFLENNRKNAKLGGQASKLVKSLRLEYKGVVYLGWKELFDMTGVSKFLYKKFYLRGFDPSDRIGKNGPTPKNYVYKSLNDKENP